MPVSPVDVLGVVLVLVLALVAMVSLSWYVSDPGLVLWSLLAVAVFSLLLGWPLLVIWRHQLVLDAAGLHVRTVLRTRHFPWLASRDRIAAVTRPRRHGYVADAVLLDAAGRRSALLGLRAHGPNQVTARGHIDAEVDRLWARATTYGWVRDQH